MIAAPAVYYVSASTGADSNPGTIDAPWQHLAVASARIKQGDLLLLRMGNEKWPDNDCIKVSGDSQTFATYGTGSQPTFGTGCTFGIDNEGFNDLTVQGLHITGTKAQGIFSVALKDGQNQRGRILAVTVDNTGDSGILVRNRNAAGAAAVVGWQILNSVIGRVNRPTGLNYQVAGIQLYGIQNALVKNNQVATVTQMGIQDRPFYNATCSGNTITKNRLTNNEGNITAVCPRDHVSYNSITNSRGFGLQVGDHGDAGSNTIAHLKRSTDGTLYNGIDGKNAAYATYKDNVISDVSACSITVEGGADGPALGVTVTGGTIDATSGDKCAVYVTADSMPVKFDSTITWKTTGKAFRMGGLGNGSMQDQATFLKQASATK